MLNFINNSMSQHFNLLYHDIVFLNFFDLSTKYKMDIVIAFIIMIYYYKITIFTIITYYLVRSQYYCIPSTSKWYFI